MKLADAQPDFPVIGILGGGQLAQMIAQAAVPLGVTIHVMVARNGDALPGLREKTSVGDWNDPEQVVKFCQHVDVLTLENEFVNPASLDAVAAIGKPCFPTPASLRLIQDKWRQKQALIKAGLPVVACLEVSQPADVAAFAETMGWPVVLKRRHMGYDGKGNATIRNAEELDDAWARLIANDAGLYVEAFCPFERELAVMVCRSSSGEHQIYPVVDTVQKNHICHIVRAPSALPSHVTEEARHLAIAAIEAIGGIGSMGVEMFLTADQRIVINELAPRVHNSGHYSIEACSCSQFENHLRAILGWPLGATTMIKPAAVMINLLGEGEGPALPHGLANALAIPGAHLHLYGKSKSMTGRKMGHVTALGETLEQAESIAQQAADRLQFGNAAKR